jgi:hypothetical protein
VTSDVEGVVGAGESALVADAGAAEIRVKAKGVHGPCANCGAPLSGPHCHECGQLADDLHRPVWSLVADAFEGLFSLDGRFLKTVPALLFRPGQVSATYLKGGRARFVQPFRLYLFSALAFLLAVSLVTGDWTDIDFDGGDRAQELTEAQRDLEEQIEEAREDGDDTRAAVLEDVLRGLEAGAPSAADEAEAAEGEEEAEAGSEADGDDAGARDADDQAELARLSRRRQFKCDVRNELLPEELGSCAALIKEVGDSNIGMDEGVRDWPIALRRHLVRQAETVIDDPSRFLESVNRWMSRVLIGLFPVYALLLGIMHFWKRRFFYYDHVIVSLHFHAFLFLMLTILIAAYVVLPIWLLCVVFFVWSNLYLYKTHRLVYGSGRFTSVLRTLVLDFAYLIILSFVPIVLAIGGFLTA